MSGHKTRKDYITSSWQMVNTGADISPFGLGIKTPEAKILENQHKQNAMMAQSLKNQALSIKATGMGYQELQKNRKSTERSLSQVDQTLRQGFNHLDGTLQDGFEKVDNNLSNGFNQVGETLTQGFGQVDGTLQNGFEKMDNNLSSGFNQVGETLTQGFGQVDGTLQNGFEKMDNNLSNGFNQVGETLTQGFGQVDETLQNGFANICQGLSVIDNELVQGFTATIDAVNIQTHTLGNRIFDVGKAIVGKMEQENHLTRGTIQQVGRHFVTAVQNEGQATRQTLINAAQATITSLTNEGAMTRQSLFNLNESISKNFENLADSLAQIFHKHSILMSVKMDNLSDKLSRQGEMKSREHTRVALGYFKSGMFKETWQALDQATQVFNGYYPAIFLKGVLAFWEEQYEEARAYFKAADAQAGITDPEKILYQKTFAVLMLGRIQATKGNWDKADEIFAELGRLNPSFIVAAIEQSFAIYQNENRGSIDKRIEKIARGFNRLNLKDTIVAWYGLALLLSEDYPEEAASAFNQGIARHQMLAKKIAGSQVFAVLRELYPQKIKFLYKAIMIYKPELEWLFNEI